MKAVFGWTRASSAVRPSPFLRMQSCIKRECASAVTVFPAPFFGLRSHITTSFYWSQAKQKQGAGTGDAASSPDREGLPNFGRTSQLGRLSPDKGAGLRAGQPWSCPVYRPWRPGINRHVMRRIQAPAELSPERSQRCEDRRQWCAPALEQRQPSWTFIQTRRRPLLRFLRFPDLAQLMRTPCPAPDLC
jgi:hypothetical protein